MAIIIDTNCFARVFCRSNKEHADFAPVLDWIIEGNGIMVYGGTKYNNELNKCKKYIPFFNLLKTAKKTFKCNCAKVDELQAKYEGMINDPDFDDPHLPAIVLVSKCRLICSKDYRSIPFVTSRDMYPKRFHLPQYYSSAKDKKLLCDDMIDERLKKYCHSLNKRQKDAIYKFDRGFK